MLRTTAKTGFDWDDFQARLWAEFARALETFARAHRRERFYAVALHGVYRELDGPLALPILAAAPEADRRGGGDDPRAHYSPPDWSFPEIALGTRGARALESALTAEATRSTQAHWRRVEARYFKALTDLACRLRDEAPSRLAVTDDFVAFWDDEEGGAKVAARSIPPRLFKRIFAPELARGRQQRDVGRLPVAERAAFLVSRFGCFDGVSTEDAQAELLALGEEAVPALVKGLAHPKHGWTAARVLGQLGVATPQVVQALRARAGGLWFALALGMLGDHDWLSEQGGEIAVNGLCARLKDVGSGQRPPVLDYRPLERFLDGAPPKLGAAVEAELRPGSSYAAITAADADEAVRGLQSRHAVVRWHAASVLGERRLGAAVGKRVLPLLAERLRDPNPLVRRLAVLGIDRWKQAGRPFRPQLEPLLQDPDETVRRVVASVLGR